MTTYQGTLPNGNVLSSIYPNVYRVRYRRFFAGRLTDIDKLVTGTNDLQIRGDISRRYDVRGEISVEHVQTLEAN